MSEEEKRAEKDNGQKLSDGPMGEECWKFVKGWLDGPMGRGEWFGNWGVRGYDAEDVGE